jgi:hypothetical protein
MSPAPFAAGLVAVLTRLITGARARWVVGGPMIAQRVYLQDLNRILPKGEILPVPLLSSATFGAPLSLAPGEDRPHFLECVRAALISLEGQS